MSQAISLNELISYYENVFVKSYADLVALTADKPAQVLVEIENFNSHLIVVLKNESDEIASSNLKKAKTHLQRGTLDCYKMQFIKINNLVLHFLKDLSLEDVQFALGDNYKKCVEDWIKFSRSVRETRRHEVASTGHTQIEDAIAEYRAAVEASYSLYEIILNSTPKVAHVRKHLFWHSFKIHWPYHLAEIIIAAGLTVLVHSLVAG